MREMIGQMLTRLRVRQLLKKHSVREVERRLRVFGMSRTKAKRAISQAKND